MTEAIGRITDPALRKEFDNVRRDLHRRFGHLLTEEAIDEVLAHEITTQVASAKIKTFLPTLVERETVAKLEESITAAGGDATARQEILFVCRRDAGRSQLASSITKFHAGEGVIVRTVGLKATEHGANTGAEGVEFEAHRQEVYPEVIAALEEKGYPTHFEQMNLVPRTVHRSDVIVLLGVQDIPGVPGKRYENWDIADPKGKSLEEVRAIRDQLEEKILQLLKEMNITVNA